VSTGHDIVPAYITNTSGSLVFFFFLKRLFKLLESLGAFCDIFEFDRLSFDSVGYGTVFLRLPLALNTAAMLIAHILMVAYVFEVRGQSGRQPGRNRLLFTNTSGGNEEFTV
jgi:hypothetical protein